MHNIRQSINQSIKQKKHPVEPITSVHNLCISAYKLRNSFQVLKVKYYQVSFFVSYVIEAEEWKQKQMSSEQISCGKGLEQTCQTYSPWTACSPAWLSMRPAPCTMTSWWQPVHTHCSATTKHWYTISPI